MNAGIDPGRWKTGVAFSENGNLLFSAIVPTAERSAIYEAFLHSDWALLAPWRCEGNAEALLSRGVERIFIGCGTSSEDFTKDFPLDFIKADERGTTLEARRIFWRLHPPSGVAKLIPTSLRTPKRNIDDLAAFAIIEKAVGRV